MNCRKCKEPLPDGARFCPACGTQVAPGRRKPKSRGNGQGSVYKRGETWIAVKTVRYTVDENNKVHRETVSKGGFRTKKEALDALPTIRPKVDGKTLLTFAELYDKWEPTHTAGRSTMLCYQAAYKHFAPIHGIRFADVDIDDLQECVDECPNGKRTKQNMKALAGLLYKFAIPRNMAKLNLGQYIRLKAETDPTHDALPMWAVDALMERRRSIPYAGHIVCQCYLGFRPAELLTLDAINYNRQERLFRGGGKTAAGTDRLVTISPKIQTVVDELTANRVSGQVFCKPDGSHLCMEAYRTAFYSALDAIGLDNPVEDGRHKYTPHSCRHTFATMLKSVNAPDADKLRIIGHTSDAMLRYYQDVDIDGLRAITDAI